MRGLKVVLSPYENPFIAVWKRADKEQYKGYHEMYQELSCFKGLAETGLVDEYNKQVDFDLKNKEISYY